MNVRSGMNQFEIGSRDVLLNSVATDSIFTLLKEDSLPC